MKKTELKTAEFYIRKRDKMFVHIEKFGTRTVTYITHPMLVQWDTLLDSFLRGFRPATKEEIESNSPDMSILPTSTRRKSAK